MTKTVRILLVDDEKGFCDSVKEKLELKNIYDVMLAHNAETALHLILENEIDVAVVDIRMPGMDGITLLGKIKEICLSAEVIVITGAGSIESAVDAIKKGAFHYVTKPIRMQELESLIQRAYEKNVASKKQERQTREIEIFRKYDNLIYRSKQMTDVVNLIGKVALSDSTILIEGETGTGKEMVAFMLHRKSLRHNNPFLVFDCSSVAESLIESELFGYLKGAFTDANETKIGIVEAADEGALFIDEISELSKQAQAKLLRMVERNLIRKIGSSRETSVNVRIIAATNKDLQKLISKNEFREDLYYRLNILKIKLPPLRERKDDILSIAQYYLVKYSKNKILPKKLTCEAEKAILLYSWPGNVRELANTIERACLICEDMEITPFDLGLETSGRDDTEFSLYSAEKKHIQEILKIANNDKKKTSEMLGITLRHLYRKLHQYNIT